MRVTGKAIRMKRILRRPEVTDKTGLRRSAIYQRMANGTFPKSIKLGPKAIGWAESEIDQWIDARIAERDAEAAA